MKNKKYVLIYRVILLILIVLGIILNYIAKDKSLNLLLSYYTIQSNLIVQIFLSLEIINYFKPLKIFKGEKTYQNIKGMVTLIILVTGLIFAIVLAPFVKEWTGFRLYSSYILHYICPTMILIDWLFFDRVTTKLLINKNYLWLIYPILYYCTGVFRILFLDGFIPYPFMDVKNLGVIYSIIIFLGLVLIFYVLSVILVKLKNRLCHIK